jgi:hypothetical protein
LKEIAMKSFYLAVVFGWALFPPLFAQAPAPATTPSPKAASPLPTEIPNDTVVAKVDGKDVTAGDVYAAILAMPPEFVQLYNRNPQYAVQQLFMMRFLSTEADKYNLAERAPYKQQLEAQRDNILAGALLGYMQDHFPVEDAAVKKYYDEHKTTFQQAQVKDIMIRYKPVFPPGTPEDVKMRAEAESKVYNVTRTEEQAKARAKEAYDKLKAGADFKDAVIDYSEDKASVTKGGDIGVVGVASQHPEEIKRAVANLKAGELSEPIRTANAYVIFKVDAKTQLELPQVQELIATDLRKQQINQWFRDVTARFQPKVVNQQFFTQPAPVPGGVVAPVLPH